MSSKPQYTVGYGKPPAEHQWKPGQSGNPKGSKKKPIAKDFGEAILQALLAEQTVTIGGSTKIAPTYTVLAQLLIKNALHAKGSQLIALVKWLEEFGAFDTLALSLQDSEAPEDIFTEEDLKLMQIVDAALKAANK